MEEEIISIASKDPTDSVPSQAETLPTSPSYLVQALVADKEASSTLTKAITSALAHLIQNHAVRDRSKDSENPAAPVRQSGVETNQSKTAQLSADLVATQNSEKRTFAASFGVSGEIDIE